MTVSCWSTVANLNSQIDDGELLVYSSQLKDCNKKMEAETATSSLHPNISQEIFHSFKKIRNDHEFKDWTVFADAEIISCHSFILASCSELFRGLLKSNMREKKEMILELNNVSSSTFQLILNSLYSGCDLLTKENVLDVWSAVHELQIQFLIDHCEDFVINDLSLDTVEVYTKQAEYLHSKKVQERIFNFMLNKFEQLRQKDLFVRLDFEYLIRLLKSDKLVVSSEDVVLYSILEWVNYGDVWTKKANSIKDCTGNNATLRKIVNFVGSSQSLNVPNREISLVNLNVNSMTGDNQGDSRYRDVESNDRRQLLIHLLKASRYYLASEACIGMLYKDNLIQKDVSVKEILFEAINFKLCGYSQNYCPTPAINRDCSKINHVAVYYDRQKIVAISLKGNKYVRVKRLPTDVNATITILKGRLYVCLLGILPVEVYLIDKSMFLRVTEITHDVQLFLAHEKYIYAFDAKRNNITRFNPETFFINRETSTHEIDNLAYALSFQKKIVLFSSVVRNGVEETAVHSWNTDTNVWTKHGNLKLFAQNLQSFQDDVNTYILDVYGNLWKMANLENIGFSFVAKLWTEKCNVKGSILFRETLYLMIGSPDETKVVDTCDGVYTSVSLWEVGEKASNVLHFTRSRRPTESKPNALELPPDLKDGMVSWGVIGLFCSLIICLIVFFFPFKKFSLMASKRLF